MKIMETPLSYELAIYKVNNKNEKENKLEDVYRFEGVVSANSKFYEFMVKYAKKSGCYRLVLTEIRHYDNDKEIISMTSLVNDHIFKKNGRNPNTLNKKERLKRVQKEIFLTSSVEKSLKLYSIRESKMEYARKRLEDGIVEFIFSPKKEYYQNKALEVELPKKKEMKRTTIYLDEFLLNQLKKYIDENKIDIDVMTLCSKILTSKVLI